jgi:hypothetical protein
VLAGAMADVNAAFGGTLNMALETPQGQLASSLAAIISDCNNQFLSLSYRVDPAYADGTFQDAIARIYFLTRNPAQSTVVQATCSGLAGVVIPVGAVATAEDGNTYLATSAGTISAGGSVVVPFACETTGPITCPIGGLNTIAQTIPGWDSITNAAVGVVGNAVENRQDFEYRRALSVEGNATGIPGAIQGAVAALPDVLDCFVYDNATNGTVTVGSVAVGPNSIYVSVAGGTSAEIAYAIWSKKPPGCGYTGSTSATVVDPNPAYNGAGPSYTVSWQTAGSLAINIQVSIPNTTSVPSNALALITAAAQAAFNGTDQFPRVSRIGSTVYALRFVAGINGLGTWANVISITVSTTGSAASSVTANSAQIPELGTVTLTLV